MRDILKDWKENSSKTLEQQGFKVAVIEGVNEYSTSVNIDGENYVGTICFWKPNIFEFQFNDCSTGNVVLPTQK